MGRFLGPVLDRVVDDELPSESGLMARIPEVFSWISWQELDNVMRECAAMFSTGHPSGDAAVQRTAAFVRNAIAWHA